jgi:L-rhamnose-H+ transport protein
MVELALGLSLVLVAAVVQGGYATFLKRIGRWKWENFWFLFSFWAFAGLPFLWVLAAIPNWITILSSSPPMGVLAPFLLGFVWGLGGFTFGLSVDRAGMAITYSVVVGANGLLGCIFSMLASGTVVSGVGLPTLFAGLLLVAIGVALSGYSGLMREKTSKPNPEAVGRRRPLLFTIISAAVSPLLIVGVTYGKSMANTALNLGLSTTEATLSVWMVALLGASVLDMAYPLLLLAKGRSYRLYAVGGVGPFIGSFIAGALWFGGIVVFGVGSTLLGSLGPSVGWAVLTSTVILVGNLAGVLMGEWTGTPKPLQIQLISLVALVAGISLAALALA